MSPTSRYAQRPRPAAAGAAQALQQALRAHQAGELDSAEQHYRRALRMHAAQPDALHYLGVLRHQRGHSDEAVELVGHALRLTPGHADAHSNLGNIHKECGRHTEAEACYRRALAIASAHPQALGNLAIVLQVQQRIDAARSAYRTWLARAPDDARGHYWFGRFLCSHPDSRPDIEQAVDCLRRAFELDPHNLRALEALGMALYGLGRIDEAAGVYRAWSEHDPADPVPQHMLCACGANAAPPRAGDEYVRKLFDDFSLSFDEQLVNNLGYRAPQALVEALDAYAPVAGDGGPDTLDVLDAGCGTGLCAPLLRTRARTLTGVDLSEGMLGEAARRGGYDELVCAELTAFLSRHAHAYDLIVCADTLVYFGDLAAVLAASCHALRAGGQLAFSLEALHGAAGADVPAYALAPSGRYQHSRAALETSLAKAGFSDLHIEAQALRKEAGRWVDGWIVLAGKAAKAGAEPVTNADASDDMHLRRNRRPATAVVVAEIDIDAGV
ncbi:tetratricopeptide repeat protein [Paraburkholderia jirisanensis]